MSDDADWCCACGWQGSASELKPSPSGARVCPGCGASGGLAFAWRDVTPEVTAREFEVQQHRGTGAARHRRVQRWAPNLEGASEYVEPLGPWHPGWPGKGLQW